MRFSINVVHLIWLPYGIELFKKFVDSYVAHPAGCRHQLTLLFNGTENEYETRDYHAYIQKADIMYQSFYCKDGQDLEAYYWVANKVNEEFILFLNSYSELLANDWLLKFAHASEDHSAGLIGTTGSWQSYHESIIEENFRQLLQKSTFKEKIAKFKLIVKAFIVWRFYFKSFPNPHVRTNAFFINKLLFLSLKIKNPKSKFDAYRIESGSAGITQQVIKRKLKILLIDKFGNTYEKHLWNSAKIFWSSEQEHLLIKDNQTDLYTKSDPNKKKLLSQLAWGKKSFT